MIGLRPLKIQGIEQDYLNVLDKVRLGNLGDWNSLGDNIFELREHFGSGYRLYYGVEKRTVILLLCGGDKSSQTKDIKLAKQYWQDFKKGS